MSDGIWLLANRSYTVGRVRIAPRYTIVDASGALAGLTVAAMDGRETEHALREGDTFPLDGHAWMVSAITAAGTNGYAVRIEPTNQPDQPASGAEPNSEPPRAVRDRPAAGLTDLGAWTEEEAARFGLAQQTLSALIASCSTRLANATDPGQQERLSAEQAGYARERRALRPGDTEQVDQILRDYPALLRRLRDDHQSTASATEDLADP
ncbi:DUF6406 domain-containing protein [Micromonospora sp. NPDC003197]